MNKTCISWWILCNSTHHLTQEKITTWFSVDRKVKTSSLTFRVKNPSWHHPNSIHRLQSRHQCVQMKSKVLFVRLFFSCLVDKRGKIASGLPESLADVNKSFTISWALKIWKPKLFFDVFTMKKKELEKTRCWETQI